MKTILHLCADIGSDSFFYSMDKNYKVILVGSKIGVENYTASEEIYGIIANPVCTEFSTANGFNIKKDVQKGMLLVNHCLRIIEECKPKFWVLENPEKGRLKEIIGKPKATYQPWHYGSPWTKKTALWGDFQMPIPIFNNWEDVEKIPELYIKKGRNKPSLADLHKADIKKIPEFEWAINYIKTDSCLRSMCSQKFAIEFYKCNK